MTKKSNGVKSHDIGCQLTDDAKNGILLFVEAFHVTEAKIGGILRLVCTVLMKADTVQFAIINCRSITADGSRSFSTQHHVLLKNNTKWRFPSPLSDNFSCCNHRVFNEIDDWRKFYFKNQYPHNQQTMVRLSFTGKAEYTKNYEFQILWCPLV